MRKEGKLVKFVLLVVEIIILVCLFEAARFIIALRGVHEI